MPTPWHNHSITVCHLLADESAFDVPPDVGDSMEGTDEEFTGGAQGKEVEAVASNGDWSLQIMNIAGYW